jgi:hypothetical protein
MRCASGSRLTMTFSLTRTAVPTIRRRRRGVLVLMVSIRRKILEDILARESPLTLLPHSLNHVLTG